MNAVSNNPVLVMVATATVALLSGCATSPYPKDALQLEETTLETRSAQTRRLEAPSEIAILTAAVSVLQDMEFNVDHTEKMLGVISASKVTDADRTSEKVGLFMADAVCFLGALLVAAGDTCTYSSTASDSQMLAVTVVVLPTLADDGAYTVRLTLQRIIYDKEERIKVLERVAAPEIYQEAFDNLRQALFIEVNES